MRACVTALDHAAWSDFDSMWKVKENKVKERVNF